MNILLLDIETAPNLVHVWGLWNQNVGVPQIIDSGYVLSWAAKWYDEGTLMYDSLHQSTTRSMLKGIHALLDEADVVVHYNGTKFDIPTLNKEFLLAGFKPPAPYKQVDLLKVARTQFKFPSNKLDYVSRALGVATKVKHRGHQLWIDCMAGLDSAWKEMEIYNKQDVVVLEQVYYILLPWIKNHPNHGLYNEKCSCPNCGGVSYKKRGWYYTANLKYQRYRCSSCGTWFRGVSSEGVRGKDRFTHV